MPIEIVHLYLILHFRKIIISIKSKILSYNQKGGGSLVWIEYGKVAYIYINQYGLLNHFHIYNYSTLMLGFLA